MTAANFRVENNCVSNDLSDISPTINSASVTASDDDPVLKYQRTTAGILRVPAPTPMCDPIEPAPPTTNKTSCELIGISVDESRKIVSIYFSNQNQATNC